MQNIQDSQILPGGGAEAGVAEPANIIGLTFHGGNSWVSDLAYHSPLRIFEVGRSTGGSPARLVLSNHGGGMLQGDRVSLEFTAAAGTKSEIRSQANTQILNNPSGKASEFLVRGCLKGDAVHHFLGEPVVMHANAIYHQEQHWELDADSRLVLTDWFQSGRSESGEQFTFGSYYSSLSIRRDGRLVLRERNRIVPSVHDVRSPGSFSTNDHLFTAYCIGNFSAEMLAALPETGNFQNIRNRPLTSGVRPPAGAQGSGAGGQGGGLRQADSDAPWFAVSRIPDGVIIRAMGRRRLDIEPGFRRLLEPFLS